MKKIKNLIYALAILILSIGIISCAEEETEIVNSDVVNLKSKLPKSNVDSLQSVFINIITDIKYINLENNIKDMVYQLNREKNVPLETKEGFRNWITLNIDKTKFIKIDDAIDLYDKLIASSVEFDLQYRSFYDELTTLDEGDIRKVLEPQLTTPPLPVANGACQEACMDNTEANIDFLDEGYSRSIKAATTRMQVVLARYYYWDSMEWIIGDFNACMASC